MSFLWTIECDLEGGRIEVVHKMLRCLCHSRDTGVRASANTDEPDINFPGSSIRGRLVSTRLQMIVGFTKRGGIIGVGSRVGTNDTRRTPRGHHLIREYQHNSQRENEPQQ